MTLQSHEASFISVDMLVYPILSQHVKSDLDLNSLHAEPLSQFIDNNDVKKMSKPTQVNRHLFCSVDTSTDIELVLRVVVARVVQVMAHCSCH